MMFVVISGWGETTEGSVSLHGAGEPPPALTAPARSDPVLSSQIQGAHLEQNPHRDIIAWPGLEGTLKIICAPSRVPSGGQIHP